MAGKEIGRATGFKLAQLQELENGKILKVGGREVFVSCLLKYEIIFVGTSSFFVQIQDEIVETAGMSGNGSSQSSSETKPQKDGAHPLASSSASNKEFVSPLLKTGHKAPKIHLGVNEIKPRYSPNYPSALIMPRPPTDIQVCFATSVLHQTLMSFVS
jgi:DNA repair and recombination protein RAD54B